MNKLWKCKTCGVSFQSKDYLDNHWLGCWEKNQGKKFFDSLGVSNKKSKIKNQKSPLPKWAAEKDIKFEKKKNVTEVRKPTSQNNQSKKTSPKTSPKIKTISVKAKCSCGGENEKCFKCNGAGFYSRRVVTNIEECQERLQEKRSNKTNSIQESQFSNDQRGGIYGIRESGRFSSNPLHEEDL